MQKMLPILLYFHSSMKTKWLQYFTPCLLVIYVCIYIIIDSYFSMNDSKGWSALGIILGALIGFVSLLVEFACRNIFKDNYKKIFITEAIIIVVAIFLWQ